MSFRFNFSKEESTEDNVAKEFKWYESSEIKMDVENINLSDIASHANMFMYENVEIGHIVPNEALACMRENTISVNDTMISEKQHSDLITAKYEGGLKVWECTKDLLEYLIDNHICFKNKNVLDLGCGTGLMGIYALLGGANVTFQDYNEEVLKYVTMPNVLLNIENSDEDVNINNCKFYCGDWASFNKLIEDDVVYDVILTSETIYNPVNYDKIIDIFSQRLSDNGTVYLAAKSHYFGVGGSIKQFETSLKQKGKFINNICWHNDSGIRREIMEITKKK